MQGLIYKATSVVKHAIGPAVHKDMVASVKASPSHDG